MHGLELIGGYIGLVLGFIVFLMSIFLAGFQTKTAFFWGIMTAFVCLEYPWIGIIIIGFISLKFVGKHRKWHVLIATALIAGSVWLIMDYENKKEAVAYSVEETAVKAVESFENTSMTDQESVLVEQEEEEYVVDETSTTELESEPIMSEDEIEWQLQETLDGYGSALTDAINSGDFTIVESYLEPGSNLYSMQQGLVSDLYGKGITENFYSMFVDSFEEIAPNEYSVRTSEEVGVVKNGEEEIKYFSWNYTVKNVDGTFYLSDLKGVE